MNKFNGTDWDDYNIVVPTNNDRHYYVDEMTTLIEYLKNAQVTPGENEKGSLENQLKENYETLIQKLNAIGKDVTK